MPKLGLILADQLTPSLASLRALNPQQDIVLLAEVAEETTYVAHHVQKIALLFSAMRHFADELRQAGWTVIYRKLDAPDADTSLLQAVQRTLQEQHCRELVLTQCGEYRLQHAMNNEWSAQLGVPVQVFEDDRFICPTEDFCRWANGRKQLRMEYFYRDMRRKTGLLMDGDQPVGGQWNFDADNRAAYKGEVPVPAPLSFSRDAIDQEVLALVSARFTEPPQPHPGQLQPFRWATTREQALTALAHFI
ncbi:MAG: cryptochrome/photolyase family protein, partial [Saccharospirillaceae bacterium]|nr:cryptochrome/photolyase family protein [Saccharospirillaceae bacterium]